MRQWREGFYKANFMWTWFLIQTHSAVYWLINASLHRFIVIDISLIWETETPQWHLRVKSTESDIITIITSAQQKMFNETPDCRYLSAQKHLHIWKLNAALGFSLRLLECVWWAPTCTFHHSCLCSALQSMSDKRRTSCSLNGVLAVSCLSSWNKLLLHLFPFLIYFIFTLLYISEEKSTRDSCCVSQ